MSQKKPFFSIIIPTYNCADFIGQTVAMVQEQSFLDWELIVVDDGSTDRTWEILEELQRTNPKLQIFQRPEARLKGPSACRNIGVENAKGEYIAFLDSDDEWNADRLGNAWRFIEKTQSKALYSGAWVIDHQRKYFRESRGIREGESLFDFVINGDAFAQTSTLIVKTYFAKKIRFPENVRFHEDFDYFMEVGEIVPWNFFPIQDILVHWEDNQSKKVNYKDCLWFYQKHAGKSLDLRIRLKYLRYMAYELVSKQPNDINLLAYKKLLEKEGFRLTLRDKLLFNLPVMYTALWRTYKKI
jgi:glycosyltransferase involved in cell wall biosynthesis